MKFITMYIAVILAMASSLYASAGLADCDPTLALTQVDCEAMKAPACKVAWFGKGCCKNAACTERFDDGGCQWSNFCGFKCDAKCSRSTQCSWNGSKCLNVNPTKSPTKKTDFPTNFPSNSPSESPTATPTSKPTTLAKCGDFKSKGGCCGPNYSAGKPCVNDKVSGCGCYWKGSTSKCLAKAC